MYRQLLTHTPLLALPIGALFVFIVVWVAVVARALTRSRAETAHAAALPLDATEERHDHR
jgi:hypothetical protein